jgi:hypothetical protein
MPPMVQSPQSIHNRNATNHKPMNTTTKPEKLTSLKDVTAEQIKPGELDLSEVFYVAMAFLLQGYKQVQIEQLKAFLETVERGLKLNHAGEWVMRLESGSHRITPALRDQLAGLVKQVKDWFDQLLAQQPESQPKSGLPENEPTATQKPMNTAAKQQDRLKSAFRNFMKRGQSSRTNPDLGDLPIDESGEHLSEQPKSPLLLKLLRFCLIVGIGIFAFSNIRPYIDIVGYLGSFFMQIPAVPFLVKLPLIGWLITAGAGIVQTIFGVCLWAILQIFELLPSVMLNSPAFLVAAISFYRSFRKLAVEAGDNQVIRTLKARYNSLPTQWIETANHNKAIAYIVDAFLCLAFYPPIKGGWDNVGLFFVAPSMGDIDFQNLLLALSSLFLVEVLYHGYRFVSNALQFFQSKTED